MTLYTELLSEGASDGRRLVRVERDQTRAVVTLCDPDRLNPLSAGLMMQLQAHLMDLAADPTLRAIVITGQDPAFCAGGDLDMIESGARAIQAASGPSDTADSWRWIRRQFGGFVRTMTSTDKIFIAAVSRAAAGVGLAFALACDVIIASEPCWCRRSGASDSCPKSEPAGC
jgi:2-(1,2-epoxy-1,2-dihydrophenyl)acetyl-CoA isomerase